MQEDKKKILNNYIKSENLDTVNRLYRYTNPWHVKNNSISPNPNATEMLEDIYKSGYVSMAKELGAGLAFNTNKNNEFEDNDRLCISIDLSEFISQGGYVYPDKSTFAEGSYFLMLEKGDFKIKIEN
jgi:hypothetical protein